MSDLENLSPRELREQIQNLTLEVDLWKTQTKGARLERNDAIGKFNGTLAELNALRESTPQPALVRTLQQKIVNQRAQLKALQKAYDEQVQRGLSLADWIDRATKAEAAVSEFVKTHCGLCHHKLITCDWEDCDEQVCSGGFGCPKATCVCHGCWSDVTNCQHDFIDRHNWNPGGECVSGPVLAGEVTE